MNQFRLDPTAQLGITYQWIGNFKNPPGIQSALVAFTFAAADWSAVVCVSDVAVFDWSAGRRRQSS